MVTTSILSLIQGVVGEVGPPGPSGSRVSVFCFCFPFTALL